MILADKINILRGRIMDISIDDMKSCLQEWFGQAYSFEDLAEIYYAVRSETDKQFSEMAEQICLERNND